MKKLAVLLIAVASLLSGCVVYDSPNRDGRHRGDRDGPPHRVDRDRDRDGDRDRDRDRDRDGVPNRMDRRPNDPTRY